LFGGFYSRSQENINLQDPTVDMEVGRRKYSYRALAGAQHSSNNVGGSEQYPPRIGLLGRQVSKAT